MALSCIVSHIYSSKIAKFIYPNVFNAPLEVAKLFSTGKLDRLRCHTLTKV